MKIFFQDQTEINERIEKRDVKICVIGVGTIGLPLATMLAKKGFNVKGLDISQNRVELINSGNVIFEYQDILKEVAGKTLFATTEPEIAIRDVEIIFVCVPTPLNNKNEMDISNLSNVVNHIHPFLEKGMHIIFESSVAIGTTNKISKVKKDLVQE